MQGFVFESNIHIIPPHKIFHDFIQRFPFKTELMIFPSNLIIYFYFLNNNFLPFLVTNLITRLYFYVFIFFLPIFSKADTSINQGCSNSLFINITPHVKLRTIHPDISQIRCYKKGMPFVMHDLKISLSGKKYLPFSLSKIYRKL